MSKKYYKILITLIANLITIFLLSCTNNNATSTSVINTPTKITVVIPTKTPFPQISVGTVRVDSINVRSGPGRNYEIVGYINKGGEFYILADEYDSENKKWLRTPLSNNSFGWVMGEAYYVNQEWVNVDNSTHTKILDVYGDSMYTMLLDYAGQTNINNQLPAPTEGNLFCANTNNYIGENITCKIPRTYCSYQPSTSGNPTYCNDKPYPNHDFTLLVWGEDWSDYDGGCLLVSGLVTLYDGKLQIEATNRSQVAYCN